MASALEMVQQQFPHLAFLINDPEIGPLLLQAVDPQTGFDGATFESKIQATNWFQSRTLTEREREIQLHTDPRTFWADAEEYADSLREVAATMGRPLDANEALWLTTVGLNSGWAADSASMRENLRNLLRPEDVLAGRGTAGVASSEITKIIRNNWFHFSDTPQDMAHNLRLAGDVVQGLDTLESINQRYAVWALGAYPHLSEQIAAGKTLADIFNPYREIVANELEFGGVEEVDMNDPEWRKMLDWRDPKTNEQRLPTASEVQLMARDRPQWWQTQNGRQLDAAGTKSMLNIFGARA